MTLPKLSHHPYTQTPCIQINNRSKGTNQDGRAQLHQAQHSAAAAVSRVSVRVLSTSVTGTMQQKNHICLRTKQRRTCNPGLGKHAHNHSAHAQTRVFGHWLRIGERTQEKQASPFIIPVLL